MVIAALSRPFEAGPRPLDSFLELQHRQAAPNFAGGEPGGGDELIERARRRKGGQDRIGCWLVSAILRA